MFNPLQANGRTIRTLPDGFEISSKPHFGRLAHIRVKMNTLVSAAIYSTATGQLVLYDPNELTTEWQRLSGEL